MPEEVEVETKDLQETIGEAQEREATEGAEQKKNTKSASDDSAKETTWLRFISLSTAIFAVFAAIGAMQSGSFVNEAMMLQIKASDTWSEYQANKQKEYLFTTQADVLLDRGVPVIQGTTEPRPAAETKVGGAEGDKLPTWKTLAPAERLAQMIHLANGEHEKTAALRVEAEKYEKESEALIERHHRFAWSVALIQVAIALAAIAALTKIRLVWVLSLVIGIAGLYYFVQGTLK